MDKQYVINCCMASPAVAIASGKKTFALGATLYAKANGVIGTPLSAADCPTLVGVLNPSGVAAGNLLTGKVRTYTLIGSVNQTTSIVTLSWLASADYPAAEIGYTKNINVAFGNDKSKFIVAYCTVLNGTGSDWVPGTTDIDANNMSSILVNQFGFIGA